MRFSTVALAITAVLATSIVATEATNGTNEVVSRDETHALGVRHKKPHHTKKGWEVYTDCKLTWYGGGQLDAPACGGATPSDSSMIVAVSTDSPFKCHDKLHLVSSPGKLFKISKGVIAQLPRPLSIIRARWSKSRLWITAMAAHHITLMRPRESFRSWRTSMMASFPVFTFAGCKVATHLISLVSLLSLSWRGLLFLSPPLFSSLLLSSSCWATTSSRSSSSSRSGLCVSSAAQVYISGRLHRVN